jgi:hypothetical protein
VAKLVFGPVLVLDAKKKWYVTNWGRKKELKVGVEGLTDEPLSEPVEEGNDQEAATGVEVEPVTEGDLEDAPEDAPEDNDVPDELEPDGPHEPVPPVPEEESA